MRQPSHLGSGPGYHLGIDLGSTCTAAAVCRTAGPGQPEPVTLGESGTAIATAAFLTDDGELLIGAAAQRRSAAEPQRVARGFTRRIGDDTPLVLGDLTVTAAEVAARFVRAIVDLVTLREGGAPDSVALTHPAGWGAHRRDTLTRALVAAGLSDVLLVSGPVAAAVSHTGAAGLPPGAVLAVYDLGGNSLEAAVLGGTERGTPQLLARPVAVDGIGGLDFDEHVLDHVRDALGDTWESLDPADPDAMAAAATLRRDCATAKEALSADVDAAVPVMLPGTHTRVRIGRADFEDRIRGDVADTVQALLRALAGAGTDPSVPRTVLLVGGSSRIPLVPQLVSAGLARPITVAADPQTTGARGAALCAYRRARPAAADAVGAPVVAPARVPQRPPVPQLRAATPVWPVPAGRPRSARVRGAAVAALATVGIALAAAATAYSVDPTLLAGEAPAALVQPAADSAAADAAATGQNSEDAAATGKAADQPQVAPVPPARSGAAPVRRVARTVRPAAIPAATSAPAAVPPTGAPVPIAPPTSAATPASAPGPADPGQAGGDPPPAGGGSVPTATPPAGHATGADSGADGSSVEGGGNPAPRPAPVAPSPAATPGPIG